MITYIELWKAKEGWINLSKEARADYMAALGPAIQQLLESGVAIVSWGSNEQATLAKVDYDYFAVWTFPNGAAARQFELMVESAGWYNYFDQVNAMGAASTPQEIIGQLIAL